MNQLDIQQAQQAVDEASRQLKLAQEALENAKKPKKYEFFEGDWQFCSDRVFYLPRGTEYKILTRKSEQQAEFAQKKLNQWLRISKFVADHDDNPTEFILDSNNYTVLYNHSRKEWYVEDWRLLEQIGSIYMSKPTAEKLAAALNSGEFSID